MVTWHRNRQERPDGESGFSLLEVLAAITILSIVSLAMTAFFIQSMSYAKGNQNKTVAVNLARNALFFVEKQSFEAMKGYFLDDSLVAEDGTVTFDPAACAAIDSGHPVCSPEMAGLLQRVPTLWDVLTPEVNGVRFSVSVIYDPSILSKDKKDLAPYLIPVRIRVVGAADPANQRSASEVEGYIANEKFVKRFRGEERGVTLIELIAALSIMSMAMLAIYGVIHFGFNTYHKVKIENSLRDEGDLIMSTVISQLYDKGATSVTQSASGIDLVAMDGGKFAIRFADEQLQVVNTATSTIQEIETESKIDPDGSSIALVCTPASPTCGSGRIDIRLLLYQIYDGRRQELELESRFGF